MRTLLSGLLVALVSLVAAPTAFAVEFAPVDTPGPALSVPQATLDAAISCSKSGVDEATRAPVLLVQGTGATAKDNWSWTYEPALDKLGIGWCQVDLPDHATGDVQVNGEYVVNAIRTMYARAGRKIAIIGHSQGGMVPRWALRFWPDTRPMVDDLIGFAPSNHGTTQAAATCTQGCSASSWQQEDTSNFMKALNSRQETFKGISYTNVYTHTDEIVRPNHDDNGSSSLHTGDGAITNVATQDICPNDVYEHLMVGLIDPVAYALAVDALGHAGPADPKRISPLTCAQTLQPGVDPVTGPASAAAAAADYGTYSGKDLPAEPPLACYTTASCATTGVPTSQLCTSKRTVVIHFPLLRGAKVALDGGRKVTLKRTRKGLVATVDLRGTAKRRVTVTLTGRTPKGTKRTLTRRYLTCTAGTKPKKR